MIIRIGSIGFPSSELCHKSLTLQTTTPSVQECKAYFVQRACMEDYACIHISQFGYLKLLLKCVFLGSFDELYIVLLNLLLPKQCPKQGKRGQI